MRRRAILLFSAFLALLCLIADSGSPAAQRRSQKKPTPSSTAPKSSQGLSISAVRVSPASFNPTQGGKVDLFYTLSRKAAVTVKVYDVDQQIVRDLIKGYE